ncbi:phosphotransferase [Undibacterium squillarum]|uniref:phosphotransferase n=1 Tax=Undibacterium squillarum TaxID=1131567 RepID=UPI0035AEC950
MSIIHAAQAAQLLQEYWQLQGEISALPSYADCNFRVRCANAEYVLKIASADWHYDDLALENATMRHLQSLQHTDGCALFPAVIPARNGRDLIPLPPEFGQGWVRLLSFVPGQVYADAAKQISVSEQRFLLEHSLGQLLGKMHAQLQHFSHPQAERLHAWNLQQLVQLGDEIVLLKDTALREIVSRHVQYFVRQQLHWQHKLPQAVLHNDANDYNLIVRDGRVAALIDFGDMCHSYRVAEIAIAACYAMTYHIEDPLRSAATIAAAFDAELCLNEAEWEALFPMICARLCQSVLMAERAHRADPDNPYILISQPAVRRLLMQLDQMPRSLAQRQLRLKYKESELC